MTEVAAGEGLEFRFDIARSGATFDAHRVVHLAGEHGLQDAMKERLLRAYLGEGELMSDHETLVRLGVEVGLPRPSCASCSPATASPPRSATTSARPSASASARCPRS